MIIELPRKIKVDTDNIRSDLAKIVKEEFAQYTSGTGKEYTYQDKLLFIDLMVIGLSTADSIYKLNEKQNSSLCAILNSYDENLLHYKDTKESA